VASLISVELVQKLNKKKNYGNVWFIKVISKIFKIAYEKTAYGK
jgi:hypothetical protein